MNPIVLAAVAKGESWSYHKLRDRRNRGKCVKTITRALPDDATRQEEKETRCVAQLYCSGKEPDVQTAGIICSRRKRHEL